MLAQPRSLCLPLCAVLLLLAAATAAAQTKPLNDLPNPYRSVEGWAKMPPGRSWGASYGVDIDRDGKSVWVFERCGENSCAKSNLDPVLKFDETGKLAKAFGGGMFIFPHGMYVDAQDNVWVTDGLGAGGKGHQVFKFSPDGKLLLTLGKPGVASDATDTFNKPSDVLVAPNGAVFVADGHGPGSNARVMKYTAEGKFIKGWGKMGTAPAEFDGPHCLAMDSRGRLFVCDRNNNRIQIFDQEGNFLEAWTQFSRPSGIWIDKDDNIYVADSESESVSKNHDGWKRGIRIGSARDGSVKYFIPDPVGKATGTSAAEGVAVDAKGNIYGAEVGPRRLMRYERK